MAKRIKILERKPQPSFGERLEAKASEIIRRERTDDRTFFVVSTLERELALTLSHIQRVRALQQQLHLNLLRQECYLDTEIMQREPRPHNYVDYRLPERDRLRDKLRQLEHERRHLAIVYVERLQPLHDRLLTLLNRHTQLQI